MPKGRYRENTRIVTSGRVEIKQWRQLRKEAKVVASGHGIWRSRAHGGREIKAHRQQETRGAPNNRPGATRRLIINSWYMGIEKRCKPGRVVVVT